VLGRSRTGPSSSAPAPVTPCILPESPPTRPPERRSGSSASTLHYTRTLCSRSLANVSEPVERLEVDVDATTAAYLRRRCVRRGDLAGAAAAVLHDPALRDAATSLARYHESREAELLASLEDTDAALTELR
jgi:hypothetical protein